jgi:outer membrane protein assembly factor BamB
VKSAVSTFTLCIPVFCIPVFLSMKHLFPILLLFVFQHMLAATIAAQSLGWRGDGSGLYPGANPPLQWSSKKNILWSTVVGYGQSSPVAVGTRIFLTVEPDLLLCLDQANGKILWRKSNGSDELPPEVRTRKFDLPTECGYATPTVCTFEERVYVLFGTGVVAAYDFSGKREWIRHIEIRQLEKHGRSASPLIAGGRLIVQVSDLFCLDVITGETLWQAESKPAFGSGLATKIGDTELFVTASGDIFRIIDGARIASQLGGLDVASPLVHDDVLYFIGGKAAAFRVTPAKGGELPKVTPLWKTDLEGEYYASPVFHEGVLYSANKEGGFIGLDGETGALVFQEELDALSEFSPSLNVGANKIFVHTDYGETFVRAPGLSGKVIQKNDLEDGSVATPVFAGNQIFQRGEKKLWCLGVTDRILSESDQSHGEASPVLPAPIRTSPSIVSTAHKGWRGNWTGRYADADLPAKWGKISKTMAGIKCRASRPEGEQAQGSSGRDGAITEWLILGPMAETETPLDALTLRPDVAEKVGDLAWEPLRGPANMLDFAERYGADARGVAYAHAYVWSETEDEILIRFLPYKDLHAWLNGTVLAVENNSVRVKMKRGWNRLLCRVGWAEQEGQYEIYPSQWHLGVMMAAVPPYESEMKNIEWQTPLPSWSIGSPVIAGDRIYLLSEPDDLICLDKKDGRILWIRSNTFYDSLSEKEKMAPAFAELRQMAKRVQELNDACISGGWPNDKLLQEKQDLSKKINSRMAKIDPETFDRNWAEMHGHAVGTPYFDGQDVYLWLAPGIGARYDRDGKRKWIVREQDMIKHHGFTSSPIVVDGRMIVYMKKLIAFDIETGQVAWRREGATDEQLYGDHFHSSPMRLNVGDKQLVYVHGMLIDPDDGTTVWENKSFEDKASIPTPVIGDGWFYQINSSGRLVKAKLPDTLTDIQWEDEGKLRLFPGGMDAYKRTFVAASPLYHEGLLYVIDCMGNLSVVDAASQELLYQQDLALGLEVSTRVHHLGTAYASPALLGDRILALGMSGNMVLFKPGHGYVEVARNKIEHVTNPGEWYEKPESFPASPVCDGDRLYIRGSGYLYCISK